MEPIAMVHTLGSKPITKLLIAPAVYFLLIFGIAHRAGAEVATGCLTASGRITKVAIGDTPDGPCRPGETEISIQLGDDQYLYYLTPDFHDGAQAITACEPGFHMASVWELLNPSNLQYDTALGFTDPGSDMGAGPPAFPEVGWIRTGAPSSTDATPGQGNCGAWTSAQDSHFGTNVALPSFGWGSFSGRPVSPWLAFTSTCDAGVRVWCLQDRR